MTVKLTFTTNESGLTTTERDQLLGAVDGVHLDTSATGGTYEAANQSYQPNRDDPELWDVHIGLTLSDEDDDQFPDCKQDLAETLAGFEYDLGTAGELVDEISGNIQ
jgi:hypothetical protein